MTEMVLAAQAGKGADWLMKSVTPDKAVLDATLARSGPTVLHVGQLYPHKRADFLIAIKTRFSVFEPVSVTKSNAGELFSDSNEEKSANICRFFVGGTDKIIKKK